MCGSLGVEADREEWRLEEWRQGREEWRTDAAYFHHLQGGIFYDED